MVSKKLGIKQKDVDRLIQYGYLPDKKRYRNRKIDYEADSTVYDAVTAFNCFHGIPAAYTFDATTQHVLNEVRCGRPDNESAEEANWPESCRFNLGIFVDWDDFPEGQMGISKAVATAAFRDALFKWNEVIKINLFMVSSASHADRVCKVDFDRLSGSTLAWSNLATNSCSSNKQQRYDIRNWSSSLFYKTVLHEVGHLIGLHHKSGKYIMNPSIRSDIDDLQPNDISRAVGLGYDRNNDPGPPDPIDPTDMDFTTIGNFTVTHKASGDSQAFVITPKIDF